MSAIGWGAGGLCSAHPGDYGPVRIVFAATRRLDADRIHGDVAYEGPLVVIMSVIVPRILMIVANFHLCVLVLNGASVFICKRCRGIDAENHQRSTRGKPLSQSVEALGRRIKKEVGLCSVEDRCGALGVCRSGASQLGRPAEATVVEALKVLGFRGVVEVLGRRAGGECFHLFHLLVGGQTRLLEVPEHRVERRRERVEVGLERGALLAGRRCGEEDQKHRHAHQELSEASFSVAKLLLTTVCETPPRWCLSL